MARFRFLEKKRGSRRTGSNLAGGVGEGLFFAALFLLGVGTMSSLISAYAPERFRFGDGGLLFVLVAASFAMQGQPQPTDLSQVSPEELRASIIMTVVLVFSPMLMLIGILVRQKQ